MVLFCFLNFQPNQRFLNDCINSKQTKKPKKRAVFSIGPVCGVLAGTEQGRAGGALAAEGQACAFRVGADVRARPGALALPTCEHVVEHSGISDSSEQQTKPIARNPPTAPWAPPGRAEPRTRRVGAAGPGLHRVVRRKTLAQDWLLCWVLTSGLALSTPGPFGAFVLFSFPGTARKRLSPRERAERLWTFHFPLWCLLPARCATMHHVSHLC